MIKLIHLLAEVDIKKNAWEPLTASEIGGTPHTKMLLGRPMA